MSTLSSSNQNSGMDTTVIHIGHDELVVRQRYEVISITNDILIGIWFLIGTIFFFYSSMVYWGTWLFLLGSIEMLIRPTIRFVRRVHLKRYHPNVPGTADAAHDF
jgi:hypothetical protein